MKTFQNRTALVTGASSGIGETFARVLAARGAHLVLVARSTQKLEALARELAAKHSVRIEVIAADLSRPKAGVEAAREAERRGLTIDVLVNNAGVGAHGLFDELPAEAQHDQVELNVVAVVDLTRALLPGMLARGSGAIVNVASTAAFQPVPYEAVYGATKAFVLSFSEALRVETRQRGVSVLALCPGATDTAFFRVAGSDGLRLFAQRESPEVVVNRALRALAAGKSHIVSGARNCFLAQLHRFLPRATVASVTGSLLKPRRAREKPAPALPPGGRAAETKVLQDSERAR